MSIPGAQIQILGGTPDRETRGERAPGGRTRGSRRAAKARQKPYFCGSWGVERHDLTRGSVQSLWCPLSPINTLGFSEHREEKF